MEGKDEKSSCQLDINLTFEVFFLGYFCTVKRKKRQKIMDVITIESGLWQELTNRIKKIERYVEESTKTVTYEDDELWVDNNQAIRLLCVSGRTLQQYRSDGKLAYKRFGKQVWYRLSDIEAFADSVEANQQRLITNSYVLPWTKELSMRVYRECF